MGKSAIAEPPCTTAGKLELTVSPDRLEAYLIFKTTGSQSANTAEVAEFLQQKRIPLDRESTVRIRQALDELQRGRLPRGGVLVKRGQTCGESRDETVQWSMAADEGTEKSALPIYRATEGQEIACLLPAECGESGLDVYGDPIPAAPPISLNLMPGSGAAAGSENGHIMAARDGACMVVDNRVCVVPLVEVEAGEFPAEGIDTPGVVIISGQLGGGAKIRSGQGVWLKGSCGPVDIISQGPVICTEGIDSPAGGPPAKIICHGLFATPKLVRCNVEVQGDAEIENLIEKSEMRLLGDLRAPRAQIISSKVLASGSAHLGDIGHFSADSQASVTVGHHYRLKHQLERLQGLLRQVSSAQAMIDRQNAATRDMQGRQRLVRQELTRIRTLVNGHVSDIGRQMLDYIGSEISFQGTIYANGVVSVAGVQGTVGSQFSGPATIAPRSVNGNHLLVVESESGRKMVVRSK